MKLYPKPLHSLEELKREKHVLQYVVKHTGQSLSFKDLEENKSRSNTGSALLLSGLASALGSKSLLSAAVSAAPAAINYFSKKRAAPPPKKSPVEALAKEILFGYLKWKAIYLTYKGIMHLVGSGKKEKHRS